LPPSHVAGADQTPLRAVRTTAGPDFSPAGSAAVNWLAARLAVSANAIAVLGWIGPMTFTPLSGTSFNNHSRGSRRARQHRRGQIKDSFGASGNGLGRALSCGRRRAQLSSSVVCQAQLHEKS